MNTAPIGHSIEPRLGLSTALPRGLARVCWERNRTDFLELLLQLLNEDGVRYCVLHSWETLPEELPSDVDLAVHPHDSSKLPNVISALAARGYPPVQCLNYFVNAYYFVFFWEEGETTDFAAVDIIFEHRRNGLIVPSGEELVRERQRYKNFWIPSTSTEFSYLLAKKTWKGRVPASQQARLQFLAERLGRVKAEEQAGRLFLGKWKTRIVEACYAGRLDEILGPARWQPRLTAIVRHPVHLARYLLAEVRRQWRRWLQPTGLFVAVLGPDGSGKSSVIRGLVESVGPGFRRQRLFHWRPMLVRPRKDTGAVLQPHAQQPRSSWRSELRLVPVLLDYWLGYFLIIRPALARSGLVIFDRYFDDLLADPKRYRYGGSTSLLRRALRWVPRPHLVLVLDAPEEQVLSRKREVPSAEAQRQRRAYLDLAGRCSGWVINASPALPLVIAQAARAVTSKLTARFQNRHPEWLGLKRTGKKLVEQ